MKYSSKQGTVRGTTRGMLGDAPMGFQGDICSCLLSDSILGYSIFTSRYLAGLTYWI